MSIWDALGGKIWHWNMTKQEANHQVCLGLKTFVSSRLPQYPNAEKTFVGARNALFSYNLGSSDFLSTNLDDSLVEYKKALFGLARVGHIDRHTWQSERKPVGTTPIPVS